ncbi:Crp/Fnr family transcriptional regulator [Sphingomonas sp. PL-96]|uniref:Crp/Fnr family transcriptional regulator n=1 Tax=Sphingomonas sp. PL-96 TaxID=2887201 RepID=UPI001E4B73E8|nr:Crp/Fnr family transcriptional regulator [Sphingomonas sp. PL-96]MCC2976587.1 Crp/Fnr family transcriptional regulator [Sphingomonas sp. PL-96]
MEIGPRQAALRLFLLRLEVRSQISASEREAVLSLSGQPQKVVAHHDFVRLGDELEDACLVVDGLVARFAQLEDGSRQIVSLHVPGDMVDLYSLMLPRAPSPLQALTNVTIIKVPHRILRELAFEHRGLSSAFWRDCVVDGAIVAQWLVNVGRRNARGRIAHLLCEMAVRYAQIGALANGSFPLAITQDQLGEALGLTSVHVNRSIKTLREEGLIQMIRGSATILDWAGLTSVAEFDPGYLHLPFAPERHGMANVRQVR